MIVLSLILKNHPPSSINSFVSLEKEPKRKAKQESGSRVSFIFILSKWRVCKGEKFVKIWFPIMFEELRKKCSKLLAKKTPERVVNKILFLLISLPSKEKNQAEILHRG